MYFLLLSTHTLLFNTNHVYHSISLFCMLASPPFLRSDLIVIDGICANGAPKPLSALTGSAARSLINLFVRRRYSKGMSEVYVSRHMFRRTCLFTWRKNCKDLSWQVSNVGVGIIFYINALVNRSFVLRFA